MSHDLLVKLTNLGNPILLLLGGLAVFVYLWSAEERRILARSWTIAFGLCVVLTIVSKVVFHIVHWNAGSAFRLLSPSGHVALGTCFYGGCALLLTARSSRAARVLAGAGTALLLGVIAATRIMLECHSWPEIAVAFAIGGAALLVFTFLSGGAQPVMLRPRHALFLVLLVFAAPYMPRVDAETLIAHAVQKVHHQTRNLLVLR